MAYDRRDGVMIYIAFFLRVGVWLCQVDHHFFHYSFIPIARLCGLQLWKYNFLSWRSSILGEHSKIFGEVGCPYILEGSLRVAIGEGIYPT